MPRFSSFNLGLYQKKFSSTSRVTGGAINIGCTKGRGSSTRIYNFLNQHPLTSATSVTSSTPVIPSNPSLSAPTISSTTPDLTTIAVFFNIPTNNGGSAIIDYQYSKDNVFIKEYNSISEASRELNISHHNIERILYGRGKLAGGFIWKYVNENNLKTYIK